MPTSGLEFHWFPSPLVVAKDIKKADIILSNFVAPLEASRFPASRAIKRTFKDEGPDWTPWADSYATFAKEYPNVGILWQSGELVAGATDPGTYHVTPHELQWTGASSPFYWEFHQFGTVKMPAREFVGLDETAMAEITLIFGDYIDAALGVAAGKGFSYTASGKGSKIRAPSGQYAKASDVFG